MSRTILSIIFLVAAIVLGVFYVSPQWTQLSDTGRQISDLAAVSQQYDEVIKNRDALLSSINSISKDNLDRVDAALPLGARAADFLVAMESYTIGNAVALKRVDLVSPSSETKSQAKAGAPVALSPGSAAAPGTPVPSQQTPSRPSPAAGAKSAAKPENAVSELPFSMEVAGSYAAVKKFLAALEHNIRLIDISEISFTAPTKADDPMSFTLKAKTYYQ